MKRLDKDEQFVIVDGERYYVNKIDDRLYLNLSGLHIKNINDVVGLEKLRGPEPLHIDLSFNELTDTGGLENLDLVDLELLFLSGNKIVEIKDLEKLTKLEHLYLNRNKIAEIKGLEKLTNLRRLDLSYNQITQIKGLENLERLGNLDLQENQIKELTGLENLRNLGTLELNCNQISEIKGLENLNELFHVSFAYNSIPPEVLLQCMAEKDEYSPARNHYPVDAQKCVEYCRNSIIV